MCRPILPKFGLWTCMLLLLGWWFGSNVLCKYAIRATLLPFFKKFSLHLDLCK